jgi:hypothetical protein
MRSNLSIRPCSPARLGAVSLLLGACAAAAVAGSPPANGIAAHWSFDEASGTSAFDLSGNGNTATAVGGVTRVPGVAGNAVELDGSTGYLFADNAPSLNPSAGITISAWYRATVNWIGAGNDPIVDKAYYWHRSPYYQYHLGISGPNYGAMPGFVGFTTAGGGSAGSAAGVVTVGVWHHFVATSDAGSTHFYVDGLAVSSGPGTPSFPAYATALTIGRYGNLGIYLPGVIDDVQIYGRALTCREVAYLHAHPGQEVVGIDTIAADLDGDGVVGGSDLGMLLGSWGECPAGCVADLDCNGVIDGSDLGLMLGSWG